MPTYHGIEVLTPSVQELCRRYHVRELQVFGSLLRADFRGDSDIDLLVEFEPDAAVGLLTLSRLQRELSESLGRRVDLVPKGGLKPSIRRKVLDQARPIYAR